MPLLDIFKSHWPSDRRAQVEGVLRYAGLACLFFYALSRLALPGLGKGLEIGYVLAGAILLFGWRRELLGSIYIKLLLLALLVQCIPWVIGHFTSLPTAEGNPGLDRLLKLYLFILGATLLEGRERRVFWLWGCATLGLLAVVLVQLPEWQRGLKGMRVDFGIRNAQHTAMFFGILLLGCVCFAGRWLSARRQWLWRLPLLLAVLAVAVLGIVVTQTRAVFLAVGAAAILGVVLWGLMQRPHWKNLVLVLALGGGLIGTTLHYFKSQTIGRSGAEANVIEMVWEGKLDRIPYTSVGVRVNTWLVAWEKIKERPLFGWGREARSWVIEQSPTLPAWVKRGFGHLHNYFIEIQLSYGLAGSLWLLGMVVATLWGCWAAWRRGDMPLDVCLFGFCFVFYFLIVNNFESYFSFWTGGLAFNLIMAGLVSLAWRRSFPVNARQ